MKDLDRRGEEPPRRVGDAQVAQVEQMLAGRGFNRDWRAVSGDVVKDLGRVLCAVLAHFMPPVAEPDIRRVRGFFPTSIDSSSICVYS